MTFIVSSVGLVGYGVNQLFNKLRLPSRKFKYPVFKILTTTIIASFIVFLVSSFTADELGYLAAEDKEAEVEEVIAEKEIEEEAESVPEEKEAKEEKEKEKKGKPKKKKEKKQTKQKTYSPLRVHFIDVGQADAALIETNEQAILVDAGDWQGNEVVPYIQQQGIEELDIVIGSHEHADHIGQMDKVLNNFVVKEVWLTGNQTTSQVFERVLRAIDENGIGFDEPRAGDRYKIGDMTIDIISPHQLTGNLNNDSIVMKITYGSISFLFTGDAEREAENRIVSSGQNIEAEILKVGHHGSDTSTTAPFLQKVNPKVAIISVGESSQYGHPDQSVIDRIKAQGIELYATKSHGNIIVTTDGSTYDVKTTRSGKVEAGNKKKERAKNSPSFSSTKGSSTNSSKSSSSSCVDLNDASQKDLEKIIHIGPARAEAIVEARPFNSVDDLQRISGIGAQRLADIKEEGLACVK